MNADDITSQFRLLVSSISKSMRNLDYPVPVLKFAAASPGLTVGLNALIEATPPNWPDDINLGPVVSIVQDEGIPLVWVPRSEHVTALIEQVSRDARLTYLAAHETDIIEDCRAVLAQVTAGQVLEMARLAIRATDALQDGHREAAQALAVTVTDSAIEDVVGSGTRYKARPERVRVSGELPYSDVKAFLPLAAVVPFLFSEAPANRWSSAEPPDELSRHLTVHQPHRAYRDPRNALIAVMLAASVLRAVQEGADLIGETGTEAP